MELPLLNLDNGRHLAQEVPAVDNPRGVVRRRGQHDAGPCVEARLKGVEVRIKSLVRGHDPARAPVVVRVEHVLDEVGREDDDLVAGVKQRLHDHVESAAGAARHHDLLDGEVNARLFGELHGHSLPRLHVAGVGHIAVHSRYRVFCDFAKRVEELSRRLHDRVAQGQVEDMLLAVLPLQRDSLLEHPADPGAFLHKLAYLPRDGHRFTSPGLPLDGDSMRFAWAMLRLAPPPDRLRILPSPFQSVFIRTPQSVSSVMFGKKLEEVVAV